VVRKVFGSAIWDAIKLIHLVEYLNAGAGKTQANRETRLLSAIWNQARIWGVTTLP
jgi:hypothetical protein